MLFLNLYKKFRLIPFLVILVLVLAIGIHTMDASKKREVNHFVKNHKSHILNLSTLAKTLESMALDDLAFLSATDLLRNGSTIEKQKLLQHYISKYVNQVRSLFLLEGESILIHVGEQGIPVAFDTQNSLHPDFIFLELNGKSVPARQITISRGADEPLRLIAIFKPRSLIRQVFNLSLLPPGLKHWARGPERDPRIFASTPLFSIDDPNALNLFSGKEGHATIPAAARTRGPSKSDSDLLIVFSPLSVFGTSYVIGVAVTKEDILQHISKTNLGIGIAALIIIMGIIGLFFTILVKEKWAAGIEADLWRRVEEQNVFLKKEIQERKSIQDKLRQAKEAAEAANKTKSTFLANMSHEIRTPLNGIIGMTEILKGECQDADQKEYIYIIHSEASALLGLINDFLDISKIEAGGLNLEKVHFDLKKLVTEISKGIAIHASRKGLTFDHQIHPDIPHEVRGDAVKVRQILANLTGNALKFTHHGHIALRALMEENLGERIKIRFEIEDTGIGIPEELHEKIFESFTQADSSTTRKYGGTGLGTTIARKLAEKMGGGIGVESNGESGSLFWFTAEFETCSPMERSPFTTRHTNHPHAEGAGQPGSGEMESPARILVAEDYGANQKVILKHLADAGYQAELVENGRGAVEAFSNGKYNLILMDVQMPELDGYQATTEIRRLEMKKQDHPDSPMRTPIIAMTANAFSKDMEKCYDAGMDDYIAKPFKKRAFLEIIQKWLSKEPRENGTAITTITTEKSRNSGSPMDFSLALSEFGDNKPFLNEVIEEFIKAVREQIKKIALTPPPKRFETAQKEAHAIRGGASNLFATHIASLAAELEESGRNEMDNEITTLLPRLEEELVQLEQFIDTRG